MMKRIIFFLLVFPFTVLAELPQDQQIVQQIINESIASYPGNCPCPYNRTSNGSSCGRRSAYSKPGGYAPICYAQDVTPAMISNYKHKHGNRL
jgi:hypothetical protein